MPNVTRDMEILRIRQENLTVLHRQLDESNARFEVGEITRTDVAQAEAASGAVRRRPGRTPRPNCPTSRAAYAAVVGQSPADLETAAGPAGSAQRLRRRHRDRALAAQSRRPGRDLSTAKRPRPPLRPPVQNICRRRALTASYGGTTNDLARPR
ncbi:MAG: hypothetical protein ACWGHP_10635 [Stenotrophomonas sp.]